MYILTAAQSYQAALEDAKLGHGYLTYALVKDGLEARQADNKPSDGDIQALELLDFATWRVPQMQQTEPAAAAVANQPPQRQLGLAVTGADKNARAQIGPVPLSEAQRPRVFYRRGLERDPLILATTHLTQ